MTTSQTEDQRLDPEHWVDRYGDNLYSYALFRMEDKELAEELVQETFVAALGARKSFAGRSSLKTWLFSIMKNKMADHLRRKYREPAAPPEHHSGEYLDEFFDPRGDWLVKPADWSGIPQQKFEQQEFLQVLNKCLDDLPRKQNDAFTMREYDDLDSEDICKVLQISPTNYWVVMHRARLVIRKCLEMNWM